MVALSKSHPSVSFIVPTLNSAKVLKNCLKSIRSQNYPQSQISILIIDGGSTDSTLKIVNKYNCKILKNPKKTGEAGKAIGIKYATGQYIALIDSDNILPDKNWLTQMISPLLKHPKVIGSEPWSYTYRPQAGFIERYSALTGVNDPYCLIAKNYDRLGYLNPSWTSLKISIKNYADYQIATLFPNQLLPTIGANGTIYKASFIQKYFKSDYFFDIDLISKVLSKINQPLFFSKVKIGIIHTFCESSISKFYRKQIRRATDLYTFQPLRQYSLTQNHLIPTIKFTLYVLLILPMLFDTLKGYFKKPDPAWFFHSLACLITLYTYGLATIKYKIGILKPLNRIQWQQ